MYFFSRLVYTYSFVANPYPPPPPHPHHLIPKVWDSNLIVYPDGSLASNRSGMPCVWTSMNMGGNQYVSRVMLFV